MASSNRLSSMCALPRVLHVCALSGRRLKALSNAGMARWYRPICESVTPRLCQASATFRHHYRAQLRWLCGWVMQYLFSDHLLDTDRRELRRGLRRVDVEPQVLDLLICLVENRDRVVSKDDLIASVWDDRIVSDSTLSSRIYAARKAVGDTGREQKVIRT